MADTNLIIQLLAPLLYILLAYFLGKREVNKYQVQKDIDKIRDELSDISIKQRVAMNHLHQIFVLMAKPNSKQTISDNLELLKEGMFYAEKFISKMEKYLSYECRTEMMKYVKLIFENHQLIKDNPTNKVLATSYEREITSAFGKIDTLIRLCEIKLPNKQLSWLEIKNLLV